jgi:hypothetical protein
MQLPHPLRLYCEIATDFRDLAFDCIRQFGGSAPRPSPRRAAYDFGLRHSIPLLRPYPDRLGCRCMSSLERNENGVPRRVQPRGRGHEADVLTLGFDTQLGSHRPAPVIVDDLEMMIQDAIDGLGQAFRLEGQGPRTGVCEPPEALSQPIVSRSCTVKLQVATDGGAAASSSPGSNWRWSGPPSPSR